MSRSSFGVLRFRFCFSRSDLGGFTLSDSESFAVLIPFADGSGVQMQATKPSPLERSLHQCCVDDFMRRAGQSVPDAPAELDASSRILRARLILEEAFETIEQGLGVNILIDPCGLPPPSMPYRVDFGNISFSADRPFDMVELVDGCCDLKVVTTGTLTAAGVADQLPQFLVDKNNLDKFGPGGHRHPETGKWIKPPGHKPPDIAGAIAAQVEAAQAAKAAHSA